MSDTPVCRRFYIGGRVQGVFFRASTRDEALRLGLTGYARNLRDGRVEVLACGAAAGVDALAAWLAHGPPLAQVESVRDEAASDTPPPDFQIGW